MVESKVIDMAEEQDLPRLIFRQDSTAGPGGPGSASAELSSSLDEVSAILGEDAALEKKQVSSRLQVAGWSEPPPPLPGVGGYHGPVQPLTGSLLAPASAPEQQPCLSSPFLGDAAHPPAAAGSQPSSRAALADVELLLRRRQQRHQQRRVLRLVGAAFLILAGLVGLGCLLWGLLSVEPAAPVPSPATTVEAIAPSPAPVPSPEVPPAAAAAEEPAPAARPAPRPPRRTKPVARPASKPVKPASPRKLSEIDKLLEGL
ncbi:MAG: hypothetical protein RBU45_04920 [Myxococcota bacterium]|jgi:hypothetical protein|nr:hypothetical protein [Myxococcota bacterium]